MDHHGGGPLVVGLDDLDLEFGVGDRLVLRRLGPGGELDAIAGEEPRVVQPHPDVALGHLVLAGEPEHDLPPESLVRRSEAPHDPPPGRIAGEGDHAAAAEFVAHQQRTVILVVGLGQDAWRWA